MEKILVIGSYNIGLTVLGERIPQIGETVMGDRFDVGPGGKGSNQAIAAARLGGDVAFLVRVGDDMFGQEALKLFKKEGLSTQGVYVDETEKTGAGIIFVDGQGRNCIGVALGANLKLSRDDIDKAGHLFEQCRYLLIQMEIDMDTVCYAIAKARQANMTIILNPAPAHSIEDEYLKMVDIITPNETEAKILTGIDVVDIDSGWEAAKVLQQKGVRDVIVTLGVQGCIHLNDQGSRPYPALKVNAVDTTGAGDAFNGGLTFALAQGRPIQEAIEFASKVAACSVMHVGVVPGLPTTEDVNQQFGGSPQ